MGFRRFSGRKIELKQLKKMFKIRSGAALFFGGMAYFSLGAVSAGLAVRKFRKAFAKTYLCS